MRLKIKRRIPRGFTKYIAGIIEKRKQKLLAIYAMPDHIHIFCEMRPQIPMFDFIQDINPHYSQDDLLRPKIDFNEKYLFKWFE